MSRIRRLTVSFEGFAAPVPCVITRIVLIGPYARRTWYEDKASLYFSDYEFWVVVNHTLYADDTRWCRAKDTIARDLGNRCAESLSVFSKADIKRSEVHTSELQSLMRISYAVYCLKQKQVLNHTNHNTTESQISHKQMQP